MRRIDASASAGNSLLGVVDAVTAASLMRQFSSSGYKQTHVRFLVLDEPVDGWPELSRRDFRISIWRLTTCVMP